MYFGLYYLLGGFLLYKVLARPANTSVFNALIGGPTAALQQPKQVFRMYAASWCHYCVEAKPLFGPLVGSQTVNGKQVQVEIVDADKVTHPLIAKQGVPLFVYFDSDGNERVYEGPRATQEFRKFLQETV